MVAARERGSGVASTLARIALINVLVKEDPLHRKAKVIAHVLVGNDKPRDLIQHALRFGYVRRESYPSEMLPGLPSNTDGKVEGDLFTLTGESLASLINWCNQAPAHLKDGRPLNVQFGAGFTFSVLSAALRGMSV